MSGRLSFGCHLGGSRRHVERSQHDLDRRHTPRAMRRVADLGHGWHGAFAVGDRMTAGLGHLRDAGVSHVVLASRGRNLADLTATYERFAADVLPRL